MSFDIRKGQWSKVAIATVVLLAFSFVFGGASRLHAVRLALVELAALPLLVIAGSALWNDPAWARHRFALLLLGLLACLPLSQLIPVPAGVWASLPGREPLAVSLTLAGQSPAWLPLSLTPELTWRAFLALLPPVAMFLGVLVSSGELKTRLVHGLLAAAAAGLALGMAQMAVGGSAFYPWATTTPGSMSGFFANRNHFATLLLLSLPFAANMAASSLASSGRGRLKFWLGLMYVGVAIVAIVAVRSRAGVLLLAPALVLSLITAWIAAGRQRPATPILIGGALLSVAFAGVVLMAAGPLLDRFGDNAPPEGRFENWPTVADAAQAYLPLGTGLGSFDSVYRSVEPLERLDATFFNQAHNEYLETWLETGWLGIALIIAFLVWFVRRSWKCWRAPASRETNLQRAASIAILLVLMHSGVDYPLRTETIAVCLALCAAILEGAIVAPEAGHLRRRRVRRAVA